MIVLQGTGGGSELKSKLFYKYVRSEWEAFHTRGGASDELPIDGLAELVSLNDRLSQEDVKEVYVPLVDYIDVMIQHKDLYETDRYRFFNGTEKSDAEPRKPFVIGIAGSVAVGKSTSARVLRQLLEEYYPDKNVDLVTTDGFLYPNRELRRRGIMQRKGFPESYDMVTLLDFMSRVKIGESNVEYPLYSHDIYDVIPDETGKIEATDIIIVEGINAFQLPQNQEIYMNEFFDFSIYIDADPLHIKKWFHDRYLMHMERAKDDPDNYYHEMTKWSDEKINDYGNQVWYTINLTNLVQYIAPTKERAHVILHKSENHSIDEVYVRKY